MKLISKEDNKKFILKGFFEEDKLKNKNLLTNKLSITEYVDKNEAFICLGKEKEYCIETL